MAPEGWRRASYGEAMIETALRAATAIDLPVLSVTKARGPMLASERFGKIMHGRDLARYRVAPRDSVVADPMLLWDGSIGLQTVVDAGLVSPDYRVYQPADDVDPRFLGYVVRSPQMLHHYQGGARGTNVRRNRIARSDFLAIPLALPPLPEQRKIATILSTMDEAIESTRTVLGQLQILKRAMLTELLTTGIAAHATLKMTDIGEMPETWTLTTVGALASFSGGNGFTPRDWSNAGLPIIRIQNLNGSQDFNHYAGKCEADWLVQPGELLFAWAGSRGASFGPTIWPGPVGVLNQHIHRVTPNEQVSNQFLFFVLKRLTEEIEKRAHGFKTTLLHLRKGELTGWPVAIPPRAEQDQITLVLDSISGRISEEEGALAALRLLRQATASALLSGDVRVKPEKAPT